MHGARRPRTGRTVRTEHFDLTPQDGRVHVTHVVPADAVDDDLAGLLQEELFGPGWLRGADLFERVFTGVVRTSARGPAGQLGAVLPQHAAPARGARAGRRRRPSHRAHCSIAGYAPVHDHVLELLAPGLGAGAGCCFGFLALRIAATGRTTKASDVSPGTVQLLAGIAPRLGLRLATETADAARFPADDGCADTVLAIHLLEHLEPGHGSQVVAEALRLAARRVVIAVPLEDEANETYGHVRTVSLDDLHRWGRSTGCAYDVHEFHGGWLVIDNP